MKDDPSTVKYVDETGEATESQNITLAPSHAVVLASGQSMTLRGSIRCEPSHYQGIVVEPVSVGNVIVDGIKVHQSTEKSLPTIELNICNPSESSVVVTSRHVLANLHAVSLGYTKENWSSM